MQQYEFHEAANLFPMMGRVELDELRESIRQNGLRTPIVLYEGKILDGRNRYVVCLELGIEPEYIEWTDSGDPYEYSWDANAERRHLEQTVKGIIKYRQLEASAEWRAEQAAIASAANRARESTRGDDGRFHRVVSRDTTRSDGQTWERVRLAEAAGVSPATAARSIAIVEAGEDIADAVVRGNKSPGAAYREIRRKKQREQVKNIEPPAGKYQIIYADPPWQYEFGFDIHGAALRHYNTMSIDELCNLPVKELAEDNAVLFLWVTSPKLADCFEIIRAWGFEYKTSFVWDKVKHVMGHYNSVRHEFLLICVRGSFPKQSDTLLDSVVTIERTDEHSEKPKQFRQMIDDMYPHGKRIELFARTKTDGWDTWGSDV